jgi:hypothetical protein
MKRLFLLAAAFSVAMHCASAQTSSTPTATVQDRSYKLLREDEDWSFLQDRSLKEDFWDPIKYIPLRKRADDWYMTLGGEVREVWEQIGNDNWGQQPYQNGYLNERYIFFSDLHYGKHVRTFLDLKRAQFLS